MQNNTKNDKNNDIDILLPSPFAVTAVVVFNISQYLSSVLLFFNCTRKPNQNISKIEEKLELSLIPYHKIQFSTFLGKKREEYLIGKIGKTLTHDYTRKSTSKVSLSLKCVIKNVHGTKKLEHHTRKKIYIFFGRPDSDSHPSSQPII